MAGEKVRLSFGEADGGLHPEKAVINKAIARYFVSNINDSFIFIGSHLVDFYESFKA